MSETDKSVADLIADALARRIVLGELPPGQKVGQDLVAAEFRASHVPVREAFRQLEARGLLISEPRRGVRVAPINPAAVREVTDMRAALEVLALRHASTRLTDADIETARQAIADSDASGDLIIWEKANRHFHRAIVGPCAMPRLLRAIDELHEAGARFLWRRGGTSTGNLVPMPSIARSSRRLWQATPMERLRCSTTTSWRPDGRSH